MQQASNSEEVYWQPRSLLNRTRFNSDLGSDYYTTRADPTRETQRLIAKLEALGHKVTLTPAA